jgi:hypothetical protein
VTVLTDSRYAALARTAAAAMGASSPDVVRGILAQWQCEGQKSWPPARNNPGNIARGLAQDLGLAFTIGPNPPQPGNPIVTFASPSVGATAYAAAITRMARYRTALNAARAGDGLGFVRAIGSSGWGTGLSCMTGVYRGSGVVGGGPDLPTSGAASSGGGTPAPAPSSSGGGLIVAVYPVRLASSCSQVTILSPGSAVADGMAAFPIPKDEIGKPCVQCADGWVPAVVTQVAYGIIGGWTDPATLPSGTANACVKSGMKPGQRIGPAGVPGLIGDAAGSFFDPNSFGPLIVNAGVLGIAAWLVLTGIRDVLSAGNSLEGA